MLNRLECVIIIFLLIKSLQFKTIVFLQVQYSDLCRIFWFFTQGEKTYTAKAISSTLFDLKVQYILDIGASVFCIDNVPESCRQQPI